ncbi:hypothetical protein BH09BAC6_BH09BAC6_11670 [soil metagenome]|jgi:hypothetical protein
MEPNNQNSGNEEPLKEVTKSEKETGEQPQSAEKDSQPKETPPIKDLPEIKPAIPEGGI